MTEEEEFQFRARFEAEQATAPKTATLDNPEPTGGPHMGNVFWNAANKGIAGTADTVANFGPQMSNLVRTLYGKATGQAPSYIPPPDYAKKAMTAMGAIRPEHDPTTTGQRVLDIGTQGVVGGLMFPGGGAAPAAYRTASKAGQAMVPNLLKPGTAGAESILTKYQKKIIGSDQKQAVIDALEQVTPLVPGSKPTAAEAVAHLPGGSPIQAHQAMTAKTPGGISAQFGQRITDQQTARSAAISDIAKTPTELKHATAARDATAKANYGAAYKLPVQSDPTLAALVKNPYVKDALPDAFKLAEANGIDPATHFTQLLHYVKLGLDKQLTRSGDTALSSTEKQAVQSAKAQLVAWMGAKNPAYEAARGQFAAASKPINQMQVGQALESKLVNPIGTETPGAYTRAMDESAQLLKKSTGQSRYKTIDEVLTPAQAEVARAVAADLERKATSLRPTQPTMLQGGTNAGEGTVRLPNMLSHPVAMANAVLKKLGANIEPKIEAAAADRYLNPQKLADALKDVPRRDRYHIIDALLRQAPGIGASLRASQEGH